MLREHTVVTVLEVVWVICKERFPRISIPFFRWKPNDLHCKFVVMEPVNHLRVMQYQFHQDGSFEGTQVTEASSDKIPGLI